MRNLLSTRGGRLTAFFCLYLTEGIPLGFTATAVATQMRRQGVSPAAVGAFVATLYLPWAWKWAIGPLVDLVYSERLGRRRGWILGAQVMMAVTLLAAMPIDFASRLGLFTWVILAHNIFAATQDVAIDGLAVATLGEAERGTANGLMFAGAYTGQAIGGSGALFLSKWIGFNNTFFFVAAALMLVTLTITLRLREPRSRRPEEESPGAPMPDYAARSGSGPIPLGYEPPPPEPSSSPSPQGVGDYLRTAARSIFGSRVALIGLLLAILPAGSYAMSLALQSNLAVELGMTDDAIAGLALVSTILSAGGCVAGGWLSDRFGRRLMLGMFVASTALPTIALAVVLSTHGWVKPIDPNAAGRPIAPAGLITAFWTATLVYSAFHGLMYGARTALYMDISNPRVGATQFTAYMAVLNLVIAYSAWWQGRSIERLGYPTTLAIDAAAGCIGIALLPWCKPPPREEPALIETSPDPAKELVNTPQA